MPRLRKLRRKQKYQYHINRKRLNQKNTKLPDIKCDAVKKAWDQKKSLTENLTSMGLVADANITDGLKISSIKQFRTKGTPSKLVEKDVSEMDELPEKHHVAETLQQQAKEAYDSKKATVHPLPNEMYRKLTRFMDKYGEDYEAMANDHTNYYQETPAQLRSQITRLKGIPQQWIPYLKSRGMIEPTTSTEKSDVE